MNAARPVDLTAGTRWRWRLRTPRGAGGWCASVAGALRGVPGTMEPLPFPRRWTAFGLPEGGDLDARAEAAPALVPDAWTINGRAATRREVEADAAGVVELTQCFGTPANHRTAWLFAERESAADEDVLLHLGADYWFELFVDGVLAYDTMRTGNRYFPTVGTAHRCAVHLAAGRHVFALRVKGGAGGWCVAAACTTPPGAVPPGLRLEAERVFSVARPSAYVAVTLHAEEELRPTLNGRAVPVPLKGMRYASVPGIPAARLKRGANRLAWTWTEAQTAAMVRLLRLPVFRHSGSDRRIAACGTLSGHPAAAVRICSGPILGEAGPAYATVSCRTDAPCRVVLRAGARTLRSPRGLLHRFRVDRLPPEGLAAELAPEKGAGRQRVRLRPLARDGALVAIVGDASPNPHIWARVAAQVADLRADAAIYVGDLVDGGRSDEAWHDAYVGPAPRFCRTQPIYAIPGNHDEDAPIWDRLFCHPRGGGRRWSARIGTARVIGIDGLKDWSDGSSNIRWLERELARAREPFVFVCDHYPPWTSTGHAHTGTDGRLRERPMHEAREVILPLLARHAVSAMICGHAHCYERSEQPGMPPVIVSGGAGGYLYTRVDGVNPHSRVFVKTHNWCRLALAPDRAELVAVDLDGKELDRLAFAPRAAAGAARA